VSGAVQQSGGYAGSEKLIAINADPKAPIFNVADVGIIGDYKRLCLLLIEQLKKRMPVTNRICKYAGKL